MRMARRLNPEKWSSTVHECMDQNKEKTLYKNVV